MRRKLLVNRQIWVRFLCLLMGIGSVVPAYPQLWMKGGYGGIVWQTIFSTDQRFLLSAGGDNWHTHDPDKLYLGAVATVPALGSPTFGYTRAPICDVQLPILRARWDEASGSAIFDFASLMLLKRGESK